MGMFSIEAVCEYYLQLWQNKNRLHRIVYILSCTPSPQYDLVVSFANKSSGSVFEDKITVTETKPNKTSSSGRHIIHSMMQSAWAIFICDFVCILFDWNLLFIHDPLYIYVQKHLRAHEPKIFKVDIAIISALFPSYAIQSVEYIFLRYVSTRNKKWSDFRKFIQKTI